jgi:hypothetical protein
MKRQLIILFAFFALSANANAETNIDPFSDYLGLEIDKLELEQNLFGNQTKTEAVSIASLDIYQLDEEVSLNFDTDKYLPEGFNAKEGMNDIDWSEISLHELEEEVEIGFDTKDYLPKNFNPYRGMTCDDMITVSFFNG